MRIPVLALALAACQGEGPNIRTLVPVITVAPERITFGDVGPPLTAALPLYVTNAGSADLEVEVLLEGPDVFAVDQTSFVVEPDQQQEIAVAFTPDSFREYSGRIVLATNDEENERVIVPISGKGVDLPFPDITPPGAAIEVFVDLTQQSSAPMYFQILNEGDADLLLGDLQLNGPPEFTWAFPPPSGFTVPVGGFADVVVQYAPQVAGEGHNATVTIPSNDPDESTVEVLLLGNGGGDFAFPEAVIDCPTEVLLTGPVWHTFDGSGSFDPYDREPLIYDWDVTLRPEAADPDAILDPDDTPEVDLYVDVAGTWEIQLVVFNTVGAPSEPAVCRFDAVPEDDLHVELSWDTPAADLDLHLLQGGTAWFDEPSDCNWCNKTPDWGVQNDGDDDPRLDIDDQGGFGPENINILLPEPDSTYDVKVHYFEDHGDGPVTATIKVWLEGIEVWTGSQVMRRNDVWDVGLIDFSAYPSFVAGATPLWDADVRTCQ